MTKFTQFPTTRYQGSKLKLLDWLSTISEDLNFNSCIDVFSGTSSVSYLLKTMNKKVYSNDLLKFNSIISKALIENSKYIIEQSDVDFILNNKEIRYEYIISDNFKDIYYTEEENIWLDEVIQNILLLENEYKQSIAFWALFQSCITKRPYGLFHRKNLEIRTREVERNFGNKKTWDTPFETHFKKFILQANKAVFDNGHHCSSLNENAFDLHIDNVDLVYLDPPYIPSKGSFTHYGEFYHFLEGIANYSIWKEKINYDKKHKPFIINKNPLEDQKENTNLLTSLFSKFSEQIILLSYRSDGIPSIDQIYDNLKLTHKNITIHEKQHQYVLSDKKMKEVLFQALPYV